MAYPLKPADKLDPGDHMLTGAGQTETVHRLNSWSDEVNICAAVAS